MRKIRPFALAAAIATPFGVPIVAPAAFAQQAESEVEDGKSLMEEGAKLLLRGIIREMEPAMDDLKRFSKEIEPGLQKFVQEMGPALGELMGKIDDITAYHPPELLPNGDIIIRRKSPLEQQNDNGAESGEIDL